MLISEIANKLGGTYSGVDANISGVSLPEAQSQGSITILSSAKMKDHLGGVSTAYLVPNNFDEPSEKPLIKVKNTRVAMVTLLNLLYPAKPFIPEISKLAAISDKAIIDSNAIVKEFCVIGDNVEIGSGTIIMAGVKIADNVKIGKGCKIFPNVVIYENSIIGDRVIINSGTVIGADGFGFIPTGGVPIKIPHVGNVVIEDDVEIGANSCIDKGTIGSTIIGAGTKLDNIVQIAHNVKLGKGCLLAGHIGISGSTELGDNVIAGGQVGFADHLKIASNTMFAAMSGVSKNITESGTYGGAPVMESRKWMKINAIIKELPEWRKKIMIDSKEK